MVELRVEGGTLVGEDAGHGLDSGLGQRRQTTAAVSRVGIDRADDYAGKASAGQRFGAGRGASVGAARLEGDVSSGPAGAVRIFQGA